MVASIAATTALPATLEIARHAHRLRVHRDGIDVPTIYWEPSKQPRGIVMICHGGSGHKLSHAVLALAAALLPLGMVVLAVDGPVHGDRRTDGDLDPETAKLGFRAAWRAGVGRHDISADFIAALDALTAHPRFSDLPIGYIGVSMGTAYGIPLLARDIRIRAAVIGLWSTTYPASDHLAAIASTIGCPIWFTQQLDDEFFDHAGVLELFRSIGSQDKRLVAYPGPHRELEDCRLSDAVAFIRDRLLAR